MTKHTAILLLLFASLASADETAIVRVIDGDTVVVDVQLFDDVWLKNANVRLRGINCPELRTSEGKAAREFTIAWFAKGGWKFLLEKKRDKYGRPLGDFESKSGKLSAALVEAGHAVYKTY